jgi:hypothetical protein
VLCSYYVCGCRREFFGVISRFAVGSDFMHAILSQDLRVGRGCWAPVLDVAEPRGTNVQKATRTGLG